MLGSYSDEIGERGERDPDRDEQECVGNKIRENHEGQPAEQRNDGLLLLAIQEESEPDGTEKQSPEK